MSGRPPGSTARPRRNTNGVFGSKAPPQDTGLPEDLCITVVEFLTYLPNGIRNYEPLLRFVQAGMDRYHIVRIANFHRQMVKTALDNSCGHIIRQAMRDGTGDDTWNHAAHKKNYSYERQWDDQELTFNDVDLNCHRYADAASKANVKTRKIAFADLALDVNVHPSYSKGDGFMLTRCVQYAAANPDKGYMFPDDYERLAQKLDDGRQLTAAHYDKAALERWSDRNIAQSYGNTDVETFDSVIDDEDHERGLSNLNGDGGEDLATSDAEPMAGNTIVGAVTGLPLGARSGLAPPVWSMFGGSRSYSPPAHGRPAQENAFSAFLPTRVDHLSHGFVNDSAPSTELERHAVHHSAFCPSRAPVVAGNSHSFPMRQTGLQAHLPAPTLDSGYVHVGETAPSHEVGSDPLDEWDMDDAPAPPVVRNPNFFGDAAAQHHFMGYVADQHYVAPPHKQNAHYPVSSDGFSDEAGNGNFQSPFHENDHHPVHGNQLSQVHLSDDEPDDDFGFSNAEYNVNHVTPEQMPTAHHGMSGEDQHMTEHYFDNEDMIMDPNDYFPDK